MSSEDCGSNLAGNALDQHGSGLLLLRGGFAFTAWVLRAATSLPVAVTLALFLLPHAARAQFSDASLQIKVRTVACEADHRLDSFEITNTGNSPLSLSDVSVRYWAYDTTGLRLDARVLDPGSIHGGPPLNDWFQDIFIGDVAATTTSFSPACGPDSTHQANWEIQLTDNGWDVLLPGEAWSDMLVSTRLEHHPRTAFTPGEGSWYSECVPGWEYTSDPHYAVYYEDELVFNGSITAPDCQAPHGSQVLSGYWADNPNFPVLGNVPGDQLVSLAVGLPVVNPSGLTAAIRASSDPKSSTYRQYGSYQQFVSNYGAAASDYTALTSWAGAHGLTVTATYPTNLLLDVQGPASAIAAALYANLVYRPQIDGTTFVSLDRNPSLDLAPTVLHISGLTEYFAPQPAALNGSGPNQDYWGWDFRDAYLGAPPNSCSALDGTGQVIGLFELGSGYDPQDPSGYRGFSMSRPMPQLNIQSAVQGFVSVDSFSGLPAGGRSQLEVTLDIDAVYAMAPNASIVVFEGASGSAPDVLHTMANFGQGPGGSYQALTVANASWLYPYDDNAQQALTQMAYLGVSFFSASGDTGSLLGVSDSRTMDYQTLVGGTVLSTNPSESDFYAAEDAWPGSTGGYMNESSPSICFATCQEPVGIPWYQQPVDMTSNGGSSVYRNFPDVSAVAQDIAVILNGAKFGGVAGTSNAAPIWAGLTALANQAAQQSGLSGVGFANPVIDAIGDTHGYDGVNNIYASVFHDINDGQGNGEFITVAGYDLVTGWGTPTCGLVTQLAQNNPTLPVPVGVYNPALLERTLVIQTNLTLTAADPNAGYPQSVNVPWRLDLDLLPSSNPGQQTTVGPILSPCMRAPGFEENGLQGSFQVQAVISGAVLNGPTQLPTPLIECYSEFNLVAYVDNACSVSIDASSPQIISIPQLVNDESATEQVQLLLAYVPAEGEPEVTLTLVGPTVFTNDDTCAGEATNLSADPADCGSCGNICSSNQCHDGECSP